MKILDLSLRPLLLVSLSTLAACDSWLEPIADTPENLRLAIVTVSLTEIGKDEPIVSREAAEQEVRNASEFWESRCGISFTHAGHQVMTPWTAGVTASPVTSDEIDQVQERFFHPNYISAIFVRRIKPDPEHHPEGASVGGVANYPDDGDSSILLSRDSLRTTVLSHELGHYFGLYHTDEDEWDETGPNDAKNLLYKAYLGYDEQVLTEDQCELARQHILAHERLRPICRPDSKAAPILGNCPEIRF